MPKSRAASVTLTPISLSRFGVVAKALTIETHSLTCSAFATCCPPDDIIPLDLVILYSFGNGVLSNFANIVLYIVV
jgi:hypothetical protein